MAKFNSFAYCISQYLWLSVMMCIVILPAVIQGPKRTAPFKSKNPLQFNESVDPAFFAHLTDLHISHFSKETSDNFMRAVEYITSIDPAMTLVTGDLADDFTSYGDPHYADQQLEDYEAYSNVSSHLNRSKLIEMAGNHDEFGVFSFDSPHHYYTINRTTSDDNFTLSHKSITLQGETFHFVAFSPYAYPSAHSNFVFWPRVSLRHLNLLQAQLAALNESDQIIVLSHYPLGLYSTASVTTYGKEAYDLLTSGKVGYFISGHLHPKDARILHHSTLLEIVGGDMIKHHEIGIITFDNGRFRYHQTNINEMKKIFVTNPIPTEQLSGHSPFSDGNASIRVISFGSVEPNIKVSGDVSGTLDCRNASTFDGFVCSKPMSLPNGAHNIKFSGDLNESLQFTICPNSPEYQESLYFGAQTWGIYMTIVGIYLIAAALIVPFPVGAKAVNCCIWIECGDEHGNWLFAIFRGLLVTKCRMQRLPSWFKICLLGALMWPFCLPMLMIEIEGHLGMIFAYGYLDSWKAIQSIFSMVYMAVYAFFILIPISLVSADTVVPFRKIFIVDIAIAVVGVLGDAAAYYKLIVEIGGFVWGTLSPCFVLIPLALHSSLFYIWIKGKKIRDTNIDDDALIEDIKEP